jgi:hypothetical protein
MADGFEVKETLAASLENLKLAVEHRASGTRR